MMNWVFFSDVMGCIMGQVGQGGIIAVGLVVVTVKLSMGEAVTLDPESS